MGKFSIAATSQPRLRVVWDVDSVPEREDERTKFLQALLSLEYAGIWRYGDSGPPAETLREEESLRMSYAEGWLVLDTSGADFDSAGWVSRVEEDGRYTSSAVDAGDYLEVAQHFAVEEAKVKQPGV